jgi:hypothetical protein
MPEREVGIMIEFNKVAALCVGALLLGALPGPRAS